MILIRIFDMGINSRPNALNNTPSEGRNVPLLVGPSRMALPPPLTHRRSGKLPLHTDVRGLPRAAIRRAKVVLMGVFASDLIAIRNVHFGDPPVITR